MLRLRSLTLAAIVTVASVACDDDDDDVVTPPPATQDIVETASNAGSFNTLVAALDATDLDATLSGPGPFTVFAPTDAAFAALPAGTIAELLLPANRGQLESILTLHVVSGNLSSADLADMTSVMTLNGESVQVTRTADGRLQVGRANVVDPDIVASNGVIHAIDAVLLPTQVEPQ